jgi:transcriptional regulator with XRE-family HTH domain
MRDETLGQVFKRYREAEGIKIAQVEKDIKISHQMIEALEADDYNALPDELYVKNIIKTYARYLALDYNRLLLLYDEAKAQKEPHQLMAQSKPVKVIITPQRVRNLVIIAIVLLLLGYLAWQLNQVFQAPALTIYQPAKDLVITQNFIEIKGKTEKEARVYINEKEVFLDFNGEFKATLDLQKGMNLIKITAVKKRSAENTVYREILVQ